MAFPCLRWANLPLCICTLQTSLDSFASHPALDKHRQEMNVVLQWFTPYWKHLLSKKSIQSSFGFTCLLFSLASADKYLFIWLFPKTHHVWFLPSNLDSCVWDFKFGVFFFFFTSAVFNWVFFIKSKMINSRISCAFTVAVFHLVFSLSLIPPRLLHHLLPLFPQNATFLHFCLLLFYLY